MKERKYKVNKCTIPNLRLLLIELNRVWPAVMRWQGCWVCFGKCMQYQDEAVVWWVWLSNRLICILRARSTWLTCCLWRTAVHRWFCGRLTASPMLWGRVHGLENTVKLLRCKEAHLVNEITVLSNGMKELEYFCWTVNKWTKFAGIHSFNQSC